MMAVTATGQLTQINATVAGWPHQNLTQRCSFLNVVNYNQHLLCSRQKDTYWFIV